MRIAIPVEYNKKNVCPSFGRTEYFMFFDCETEEKEFFDNAAIASQGGAGIVAAQIIVDKGADVLLTPRMGENAADVLNSANIKIYKTNGTDIEENLIKFKNGELLPLSDIHKGFHGGHK